MLFTWNTKGLCIVFKWWHVSSTLSLIVSLIAVVAIVAGYEALREGIRQYEAWVNRRAETAPRKSPALTPSLCTSVLPATLSCPVCSKPQLRSSALENPRPLLKQHRSSG